MILLRTRGRAMKQTLVTALLWVSQDCRLHKCVAFALLHVSHHLHALPSLPAGTYTNAHSEMPPVTVRSCPLPVQTRCVPPDVLPWLFPGLCQRAAQMGSGYCG